MIIDRAYQGGETRQLVLDFGMARLPRQRQTDGSNVYDRITYKRRHEGECLFRRPKGLRRIFLRLEKRDAMQRAFVNFALIVDMIKC